MRKWVLAGGLGMALASAGVADGRTGDLDSLNLPPEAQTLEMLWASMESEMDSLWEDMAPEVEKQRAHYFAPTGPKDQHWAERGVDMAVLLGERPGGVAANVLYSGDGEGPMVQALNPEAAETLVKDWAPVAARRFAPRGGAEFVSMLAITPAHLLVSHEAWEKVGKGYCPKSPVSAPADHMAIYRDLRSRYDPASETDGKTEGAAFAVWTALSRVPTPRVCWIYVEVVPGAYETRSFDAEGRPLAHMDEGTKSLRIVPVADLRMMLTARRQPVQNKERASR